jgi:hypothetical protein
VWQDLLEVIVSDDNAASQVVRLRILTDNGGGGGGDKDGDGGGGADPSEVTEETMKKLDSSYLRDLKLQVRILVKAHGDSAGSSNHAWAYEAAKCWVLLKVGMSDLLQNELLVQLT